MNGKDRQPIAQITWIAYPNYGTYLQAFALQRTLASLGVESLVIDDVRYTGTPSKLRVLASNLFKILTGKWRLGLSRISALRRYDKFVGRHIRVDRDWKATSDLAERYRTFICGSDQIWSELLPDHHDGFYFAAFAPDSAKKIAYAPSLGSHKCDAEYSRMVRPWVENFTALSAREPAGAETLSDITGRRDVAVVMDPTLLLNHSDWAEFEKANRKKPVKGDKPYALAYFLTYNREYFEKSEKIAREKGLKLVIINPLAATYDFPGEHINCGPLEFLSAIAGASCVLTDSFHGTIFAMQFHRPFITFKRFKASDRKSQNSRIENLFALAGIDDNFLDTSILEATPSVPDWDKVEEALESERKKSLAYLKKSLR